MSDDTFTDPEPYEFGPEVVTWWGLAPAYFATKLAEKDGITDVDGLLISSIDGENTQHFFPRPVALYLWGCIGTLMEQYGWDMNELKRHEHGHDHDGPNHTHG